MPEEKLTARQWLGRARDISSQLESWREVRQSLFDGLTKTTQNYSSDGAQTTKDPHKYDRLAELNEIINQKEKELDGLKLEITEKILCIPSGNQRAVLLSYYVAGKTVEEIAEKRDCSPRAIRNVKKRGEIWIGNTL